MTPGGKCEESAPRVLVQRSSFTRLTHGEVRSRMQHEYCFKSCSMDLFGLKAPHRKEYLVIALVLGDSALEVTLASVPCSCSNWVPPALLIRYPTPVLSQYHFYFLNQTLTFCRHVMFGFPAPISAVAARGYRLLQPLTASAR